MTAGIASVEPGDDRRWMVAIVLALAIVAPVLAVLMGVVDIPAADMIAVLKGEGTAQARSIIVDIRMPRVMTGILAGIHFALAGLLLQTITRNPLADPSIMGVSQGATLAVTLFLLVSVYLGSAGPHVLSELPVQWLPLAGTLGGLVAGAIIYLLALRLELGSLRLTLCGIAIGAVLHALAIGLIAGWGSARIAVLLEWLTGSLYARGWDHALYLLPFTIAGLAILAALRRSIDLLRFEAPVARSFGLAYRIQFSLVLALACVLASSAVGVAGPITFVGLIVPHLARFLAGKRFSLVVPLTIALGAMIVTFGDLLGRLLGGADEIPIGVVTAVIGVPLLIALLRRTH